MVSCVASINPGNRSSADEARAALTALVFETIAMSNDGERSVWTSDKYEYGEIGFIFHGDYTAMICPVLEKATGKNAGFIWQNDIDCEWIGMSKDPDRPLVCYDAETRCWVRTGITGVVDLVQTGSGYAVVSIDGDSLYLCVLGNRNANANGIYFIAEGLFSFNISSSNDPELGSALRINWRASSYPYQSTYTYVWVRDIINGNATPLRNIAV